MNSSNLPTVSVVVIAYNDAGLVGEAVSSALAQGPVVTEVIAVNDASSDGTAQVLDELAAVHPRLKVVHRTENSGGCGTPRNDGIAAASGRYVLFLDSDDILPAGAADALVRTAGEHGAPVTVGAAVRRELPQGHDVPWMPGLHTPGDVIERPADRPDLVRDTLCVNKLYERAFLEEHGLRFPDGRFVYEDFVFTARVLAAAPASPSPATSSTSGTCAAAPPRSRSPWTARTSGTGARASRRTARPPGSSPRPPRCWAAPAA